MPNRVVRFGIIGAGLMGREFAACALRWPILLDMDVQPEIVAVCDVKPELLEWYKHHFPSVSQATTDYHELLSNPSVDAVYCAVPHNLHADVYCDVISSGKHLLGEKPFGIDLEANDRIMAAIESHPKVLVRVSSEFPFYPGAQRIARAVAEGKFDSIIDVRSGFLHSSDLDPSKPINWKRIARFNGEYGCMGDLGLHALHLPLRFGWNPRNVRAVLSNIFQERPGPDGTLVPCDTWDNATLATQVDLGDAGFPMIIDIKRISPGDMDTWYLEVTGTRCSMRFSTKHPKTLWTLDYEPGHEQSWQAADLGYAGPYKTISGEIFEFGFTDALLQMWAAFVDELAHGKEMLQPFTCATPDESHASHILFTAALKSQQTGDTLRI